MIKDNTFDRGQLFLLPATAATTAFLNRRTFDAAIGTKDTAISRFRPDYLPAICAFIKELAGIKWHDFFLFKPTFRAGYHRIQLNIIFFRNSHCQGFPTRLLTSHFQPSTV